MINRVILVGRLVADVELQKVGNDNISKATFTLAVDRRGKDAGTDFPRVTVWRQGADFLAKYAKKGSRISVDGEIRTGSYEKDGQKFYTTEVVADNVALEESKAESDARGGANVEVPAEAPTEEVVLDATKEDLPF